MAQGLLKLVLEAVDKQNAGDPERHVLRISEIVCELGLIAGVEAKTLEECFELFAEGTLAQGAKLTLNTAPLPCICQDCGKNFQLFRRHFACPECGSENIQFSGGHGLTLLALHVDTEESADD